MHGHMNIQFVTMHGHMNVKYWIFEVLLEVNVKIGLWIDMVMKPTNAYKRLEHIIIIIIIIIKIGSWNVRLEVISGVSSLWP
jgi:hypothetical protein